MAIVKVKLSLDPSDHITFVREVSIPTPTGKKLVVPFHFKHRTAADMAQWLDDLQTAALADADEMRLAAERRTIGDPEPSLNLRASLAKTNARNVAAVLSCAADWEVEGLAFNEQTLARFFSLYAGAAMAILGDYRISLMDGRLGN